MTTISERNAAILWIMLLTAASTSTTMALACATPFPALAALAAVHMHRRDGILLMIMTWAASQAVGFGLHGYPQEASTYGWAAALVTGSIGSVVAANAVLDRLPAASTVTRLAAAYMAGFIGFKLVVLLWAFGLGSIDSVIGARIVATQFLRNGAILIGLLALYHALVAIGFPSARRQSVTA